MRQDKQVHECANFARKKHFKDASPVVLNGEMTGPPPLADCVPPTGELLSEVLDHVWISTQHDARAIVIERRLRKLFEFTVIDQLSDPLAQCTRN